MPKQPNNLAAPEAGNERGHRYRRLGNPAHRQLTRLVEGDADGGEILLFLAVDVYHINLQSTALMLGINVQRAELFLEAARRKVGR